MKHPVILAFFIPLLFIITGCPSPKKQEPQKINPDEYKEELISTNKYMVQTEDEEIKNYIRRHKWNKKTGTGLRYLIYKEGSGPKIEEDKTVIFNYRVNLINGIVIYSSDTTGPKRIIAGKDEIESGLLEGLLMLREGDKAKIVIPSHLGYGFTGDDNKIPKRATLIYDVEILTVK